MFWNCVSRDAEELQRGVSFNLCVIIFCSVWFLYKKSNWTNFFLKKTEIEPKLVSVRLGFLGQKLVQTDSARFFPIVVSFFFFGFGSVWFFWFQTYKIKPNRTSRFFSRFGFFDYFFPSFLIKLIFWFFLLTPTSTLIRKNNQPSVNPKQENHSLGH